MRCGRATAFLTLLLLVTFAGNATPQEIDRQYDKIPEDTFAKIYTAGLLGEQYVGLEPGGSDHNLKAGSELKLTQSALVLEEVIGQFLFSKAQEGSKSRETDK
jgi:ABC-type transporter Mla subunit MlaD